jgi:hypothetical protein
MSSSDTCPQTYVATFLATVVCTLMAGALIAVAAARSDWLVQHSFYHYDYLLDERVSHRGERADVVLIGDSSGQTGVRPDVVKAFNGLSVVNLGLYALTGWDGYRIVIDRYFRDNHPPRAVVIYLAAPGPFQMGLTNAYESSLTVLRYGTAGDLVRRFIVDPRSFVVVVPQLLANIAKRDLAKAVLAEGIGRLGSDWAMRAYFEGRAQLAADRGWWTSGKPPMAEKAEFATRVRSEDGTPLDLTPLRQLRDYIAAKGVPVFVYLAPTPEGDRAVAEIGDVYREVADQLPVPLPNTLFDQPTHPTAAGAVETSRLFAAFCDRVLSQGVPK